MIKETVYNRITFADYLAIRYKEQYREDISILKMNKVLYFCFAYYGAYVRMGKNNIDNMEVDKIKKFNEYLFNVKFKAGVYGPYIVNLPNCDNKYFIQYEEENRTTQKNRVVQKGGRYGYKTRRNRMHKNNKCLHKRISRNS